jgi:hypothetical protein
MTSEPMLIAGKLVLNNDRTLRLPEKFQAAKRIVVTFPYAKEVRNGGCVQTYYRHKKMGEKPYLPSGHASFKMNGQEEIYEVYEPDGVTPAK